jgi:hypothetical protein
VVVGFCPLAQALFDNLAEGVLFVEGTSSFAFQIGIGRLPFYHKTGKLTLTLERMYFSARTGSLEQREQHTRN